MVDDSSMLSWDRVAMPVLPQFGHRRFSFHSSLIVWKMYPDRTSFQSKTGPANFKLGHQGSKIGPYPIPRKRRPDREIARFFTKSLNSAAIQPRARSLWSVDHANRRPAGAARSGCSKRGQRVRFYTSASGHDAVVGVRKLPDGCGA